MGKSLPILWIKEYKIGVKPIVCIHVLERLSHIARTLDEFMFSNTIKGEPGIIFA